MVTGLCRYVWVAIVSTQNRKPLLPPQYMRMALYKPSHRAWPGSEVHQHLWLQAQQACAKVLLLARSGRFDQRLRRLLRKAGIHTGDGRIALPQRCCLCMHGAVQVRIVRAEAQTSVRESAHARSGTGPTGKAWRRCCVTMLAGRSTNAGTGSIATSAVEHSTGTRSYLFPYSCRARLMRQGGSPCVAKG